MTVRSQLQLSASGECVDLPLRILRRDGETQSRFSLSSEVIEDYCELMLEGTEFPPVRACFDGTNYWLTDGYHRVAAAERAALERIRVEVFTGSLTDARWDSYCANSVHGFRRTAGDLKLVVTRAVAHEKATHLSNRELGRHLHVSEKTIRRIRETTSAAHAADERLATRNGQRYTIHTAKIGKARQRAQAGTGGIEGIRATLERRLASDLLMMDREASPEVRRVLNIFRNWTLRAPNPMSVLQALESLIFELRKSH